jgi:catechol 2,3-dioxygenase-like lactoylglutathione lyase family enzyme
MKWAGFIFAVLFTSSLSAQTAVARPRILGIAHVAFRASNLPRTSSFYENFLGYRAPFSLQASEGNSAMQFIKVNAQQYVELIPADDSSRGQLDHFAFYTDDLASMRSYLLSRNVRLQHDVHRGRVGNYFLSVQDPDGRIVEILQYTPNSLTERNKNNFMPASRISTHISHVGISAASLGTTIKFYRDLLGFEQSARGSDSDGQLSWIDLQIVGTDEYVELIPGDGLPSANELKAQNHLGLASENVEKAVMSLQMRDSGGVSSNSQIEVLRGGDLPPRANLFDPDGARVEIMQTLSSAGTP